VFATLVAAVSLLDRFMPGLAWSLAMAGPLVTLACHWFRMGVMSRGPKLIVLNLVSMRRIATDHIRGFRIGGSPFEHPDLPIRVLSGAVARTATGRYWPLPNDRDEHLAGLQARPASSWSSAPDRPPGDIPGHWASRVFSYPHPAAAHPRHGPRRQPMAEWIYFIHTPRDDFAATMTVEERRVWGEHSERLQRLLDDGTLVMAGPTLGRINMGVAVIEAPDEPSARRIMEDDPTVSSGLASGELRGFSVAYLRGRPR
jgi:uncharacterized protein YciI